MKPPRTAAGHRMQRARHITRLTDPAGLAPAPRAPRIFDARRERNVGVPWIGRELKDVPDNLLIATQVSLGMPRIAAEQVRYHGGARFLALRLWCDVQDAAEGDKAARERVEYHRQSFADMRRAELIADNPRRTTPML